MKVADKSSATIISNEQLIIMNRETNSKNEEEEKSIHTQTIDVVRMKRRKKYCDKIEIACAIMTSKSVKININFLSISKQKQTK